jgi:hypothetical protein
MTTMPEILDIPIYRVKDANGHVWYACPTWNGCLAYIMSTIGQPPYDKTYIIVRPDGCQDTYRIRLDTGFLRPDGSGWTLLHTGEQILHCLAPNSPTEASTDSGHNPTPLAVQQL